MRFYQSSKKAPSIAVAPDTIHRRQKRAILRAFSDSALRDHEQILQPYVDTLVEKLHCRCVASPDSYIELTKWFNYVIFDFMAHELFGESLHCLDEASYHPWVEVLFGTVKAWAYLAIPKFFSPVAVVLKPLVVYICRDSLGYRDTKYRALSAQILKRTVHDRKRPDFMTHVQSGNDPDSLLLPEELLPNYSFLMMAGSETTATLLSGCTFYILQNRDSYRRLVAEVREQFSAPAEISLSSLATLPYLRLVITETLRMYPPVPLGMPRVVPAGGAIISRRYVPEKTTVAVASWAAYQSPSNFSRPDQFIPERWLKDTLVGANDKRSVLQPFSLGPRGCPGKRFVICARRREFVALTVGSSLAYLEAGLILARLLWHFDLQLSAECFNWNRQRAFLIWDKGPLLVRLTPRQ
ncbi:cytochrome P450 [Aspergillus falconensis]